MRGNIKKLQSKANYKYSKSVIRILYIICVLLLLCIWFGAYYSQKKEADAIANGEKMMVRILDISYGRQSNLYFRYKDAVYGVKYYTVSLYHVGDSIPVLYSEKYNFFLLNKPIASVRPILPNIIALLFVVLVFALIFKMDRKLWKN